jgi:hypothetical protein
MSDKGTATAALSKGRVSRILFFAAVLGLGWVALIQVWAPPITQSQNQFTGNVAEAERFIYGSDPLPALVVGSSMVESVDVLTDGKLQVLGMNGMSAREALEILVLSRRLPRRVAVELNALTAAPNDAFAKQLFDPVMLPLRRKVLALRTEYQPASVIMSLAKGAFGRGSSRGPATTHLGSVADIRIEQLRELYQTPPDRDKLRANLISVRDSVAMLEDRGVDVIYFEYPVPHGLSKTPFHEARRAASVEILGTKAATAVCFDEGAFKTRDGIHLDAEGQQAVANRLSQMLLGPGGETNTER